MKHMEGHLPMMTIITVVRNGEAVLERTIKSIISQTCPNLEYVIVDGASTDGTLKIIKKYEKHISRWISEPDKSLYDGMNKGLKLANGKYVLFIHAGDELYNKNTLSKVFSKEKNADVYYGNAILINNKGEELGFYHNKAPKQLTWKSLGKGMVVCHQAFIIKKSLCTEYDIRYRLVSDVGWMIDGLKRSEKIVNTNIKMAKFLIGGLGVQNEYKTWKERYKMLNGYFGPTRNFINHLYMGIMYIYYKAVKKSIP